MKAMEIKQQLVDLAVAHLEAITAELRDEVKSKLRGEGSTDEGGFAGRFGDYSAQGTENYLKEQALIRRVEADKHIRQIQQFKRLRLDPPTESISLGNLVETDRGIFFISYATKPIDLNGKKYMLLGTEAPIYAVMAEKKVGETFEFRGILYTVKSIS
jgi:hypothetical protein